MVYVTPNIRYASFMLRLQWTQNDDCPTWIVSMQSTKTGELRWFPNLDALILFLRDEFGGCEQAGDFNQSLD
jgi:hypothetical protein